jgi:hypothetical protein
VGCRIHPTRGAEGTGLNPCGLAEGANGALAHLSVVVLNFQVWNSGTLKLQIRSAPLLSDHNTARLQRAASEIRETEKTPTTRRPDRSPLAMLQQLHSPTKHHQ